MGLYASGRRTGAARREIGDDIRARLGRSALSYVAKKNSETKRVQQMRPPSERRRAVAVDRWFFGLFSGMEATLGSVWIARRTTLQWRKGLFYSKWKKNIIFPHLGLIVHQKNDTGVSM